MDANAGRRSLLRNILVRATCLFVAFFLIVEFFYVVRIIGRECGSGGFCFSPENRKISSIVVRAHPAAAIGGAPPDLWTSKQWRKTVDYYSSLFQDLISEGYLSPDSKSLCIETSNGEDVFALREIGVVDAIGISKKACPPLVVSGQAYRQPFGSNTFDFEFCKNGGLEQSLRPVNFAAEIGRTLRPGGFVVVHTMAAKDAYSFNSFLELFSCCSLVRSRDIDALDSSVPYIREIVLKKDIEILAPGESSPDANLLKKCSVPGHKQEIIKHAEPLIEEEPSKPWITLKRNIRNIRYLSSMVDTSFKQRYVYVDVGARSYGSSIGSWFKKQYPKQNKTFEIYAIEADKGFHGEYRSKKGVTLLPYAAWLRNETLFFEITRDPGKKVQERGRGMGRIQPVQSSASYTNDINRIQGIDFANWLKSTVSERDFVVMKMDVEGTEFHLIPRLIETGAICLIDEIFLECHYNRWQRCCPGQRTSNFQKTYAQCLDLFSSLRKSGVLVHQWW